MAGPTTPFNVLYVGAGIINFGGGGNPWNHSRRIERKLGPRLNVVGIIDLSQAAAERVLQAKRDINAKGYEHTQIFTSIADAGASLTGTQVPHLAVIGIYPGGRGSTKPGQDAELQLTSVFPKVALFTEKPISTDSAEEVEEVARRLRERGTVSSVGYMLRYVKAVQEMKAIIEKNNLKVMSTIARYLMAYQFAGTTKGREIFWDRNARMGPIVEQATHICDLCRYLAPPVDLGSVQVNTIEHCDPAGQLSQLTIDEPADPKNRIPRMTNAIWRCEGGAVGSLLHGMVLHDGEYSVELVVLADGWMLRLSDPYNPNPKLYVRQPGQLEVEIKLGEDDCYLTELSAIIDVVDGTADESVILSTFEDAVQTYKLTWAIRLKGEETARARGADV